MRTNFYVDAFNFYYGCLRTTSHKWLNLEEFCRRSFPPPVNILNRIRYFTAIVKARSSNPLQPVRQQTLLRALKTLSSVSIHYGQYLDSKVKATLVTPLPDGTKRLLVHKSEEKGSDVNLASYLLLDGFNNDYDVAVVVSNDSDLCEPIRIARRKLNKKVLALLPCTLPGRTQSIELKKSATKAFVVDQALLASCQLPPQITDANGVIHKPASW